MYKLNLSIYVFREELKRCDMSRIIVFLMFVTIGLAAHADYKVTTIQPLQQPYQTYQPYQPYQAYQPLVPAQPVNYSTVQPYAQTYNQNYYQDPYQAQYQTQCVNPYQYQGQYYGNNLPYTTLSTPVTDTGSGGKQIIKNIGQSLLYSMIRGY